MILFILFILFAFFNPVVLSSLAWLGWVNFNLSVVFFQIFLLFSGIKVYLYRNFFELLLWSFLSVLTLTFGLFIHQLDVFACFLLVSESVVIFFILSFIIHVNHVNYNLISGKSFNFLTVLVFLVILYLSDNYQSNQFQYFTDWYTSQASSYNDLLSQYLFFYTIKPNLMLILGTWLLLLTFFLVITLLNSYNGFTNSGDRSNNYVWKKQNMWKQWWSKPFIRFFK